MLIGIIVVPLLIYTFLKVFTKPVFRHVNYLKVKTEMGDSAKAEMPDFLLYDQDGKPFGKSQMKDKLYVVYFFSSQGDTVVTKVANGYLKEDVYENSERADFIRILAISTTSQKDAGAYIQKTINKLEVKSPKWTWLTGSNKEIWNIAKNGLGVPEFQGTDSTVVPFTAQTVCLIDNKGFLRGRYEITNPGIGGGRTLQEDIRTILSTEFDEYKHVTQ